MLSGKDRLRLILEKRKAEEAAQKQEAAIAEQKDFSNIPVTSVKSDGEIVLNSEQQLAVQYAAEGREFCLIGAAGTGKTTASAEVIKAIAQRLGIDLPPTGHASSVVAVVAFTRRAVRNSAKNFAKVNCDKFCRTAHKFLEYAPEQFEYQDENGNWCQSMRFAPQRDKDRPILNCRLVIVEEASMLGYKTLYKELKEACPNAKFVFIGDLNQLPPVFGDAVLGFKLAELPVIELTKVYRQAMESPIIRFQHEFTLAGKLPSETDLEKFTKDSTPERGLEFLPFKAELDSGELYAEAVADYMIRQLEAGHYDPDQDTILVPFNKSFGSIAINEYIAEHLGRKRKAVVWEIIAGFHKKYLAVGDFVMYEKSECTIIDIKDNSKYSGKLPQSESEFLTRTGLIRQGGKSAPALSLDPHDNFKAMSVEDLLNLSEEDTDKTLAASAIVVVKDNETGAEFELSTAGEINGLDFGYAMTIHKSQGSEWRKVWLIVHKFHATMLSRELLYTGMTRAKEKLTVIYSKATAIGRRDSSVAKAIKRAVIPGKTWKDKIEYFKGKGK